MEDILGKYTTAFDEALADRNRRFKNWEKHAPTVKKHLEEAAEWLTNNSSYFKMVGLLVHETYPQLVNDREVVLQARNMLRITLESGDFDLGYFASQTGTHQETIEEHGFALQFNPGWNGKIYVVATGYTRDYADEMQQKILKVCGSPKDMEKKDVLSLVDQALAFARESCHLFAGKEQEPIHLNRIGFSSKHHQQGDKKQVKKRHDVKQENEQEVEN